MPAFGSRPRAGLRILIPPNHETTMLSGTPDYPHIVLSFEYRGWIIEIDQGDFNGQTTYAAWANYADGCAVAVPYAGSRAAAIKRAKHWVDQRLA